MKNCGPKQRHKIHPVRWAAGGILLVGTMVVYGIVSDGVSSLKSTASGTLSNVEVGIGTGSARGLNGPGRTSDSCSFPHVCNSSGDRFF